MYIYIGWLDFGDYAVSEAFALFVETDFRAGVSVRAMWTWTKTASGDEHVPNEVWGTVDMATTNRFDDSYTYGIFYNLYYPFDIRFDTSMDQATATMYEHPKSDPNCTVAATMTLYRTWVGREKDPDYNPARVLPFIRYYNFGTIGDHLFAMMVPDNLCDEGTIVTIFEDPDDGSIWTCQSDMTVQSQDEDAVKVRFQAAYLELVMSLDKMDDGWGCVSAELVDLDAKMEETGALAFTGVDGTYHKLRTAYGCRVWKGDGGMARLSTGGRKLPAPPKQADPALPRSVAATYQISPVVNIQLTRVTTTIVNDTDISINCTLRESNTGVQSKVLAGAGAALAVAGLLTAYTPLAPFAIPVGVLGLMLAGTGLYDSFKGAQDPIGLLLFPGESLQRTTSIGLPFDDSNDLDMIQQVVSDNKLVVLKATVTGLGNDYFPLSTYVNDSRLWTQESATDLPSGNRVVVSAKMVKFVGVVPAPLASATEMAAQSSYDLKDGQILREKEGWAAVYDTLNSDVSTRTDLFCFDTSKTERCILRHEYLEDDSNRCHDVVQIEGSRLILVKITYASLVAVSDLNSLGYDPAEPTWEGEVFEKIKAEAGYDLYSWRSGTPVYGYKIDKLGKASIQKSDDENDVVYIPIVGWDPWTVVKDAD